MILPTDPPASLAPTAPAPALDLTLIRKYSLAGPRYTSYPPSTRFTDWFGEVDVEETIAADNAADAAAPISLYFHLPFCETRCWFCGCNTVITRRRDAASEYLDDLELEMRLTAARLDRRRPVTQIHLGGGTPTFFPPAELRRLGRLIREIFDVTADCEFGVEIDPRHLTPEHVRALHEIGANRASLGVQDTDPRVQLAIHRVQPAEQNAQAFAWLREHGFRSINVDLIFGLPLQTPASFRKTIADVLILDPDRLSVFSYAHVPWIKPAQKIFDDRQQLPGPDEKLAMFAVAHDALTGAGYVDIGLDHFAKPDDELAVAQREGGLHRNFQGYSTRGGASLYSFGVSAISATPGSYRQNFKTLPEWRAALAAGRLPVERGLRLTPEDERRRTVIMGVMCDRRIDYTAMSARLGVEFAEAYAGSLGRVRELAADGLVEFTADGFEVTPRGVPLLRVVAMAFDPSLSTSAQAHSRTI